jgi:osmoprotectant transport system substrate-binding protein
MRRVTPVVALVLAVVLASCGGSDPKPDPAVGKSPLRIGTMNFTENEVLGELYEQALQAKGVSAVLQSDIGPRELTNTALREGDLDMYPEYVGVLLSEIHKVVARPTKAQAAYALARRLERPKGFTLLAQTRASNENALAVTKSFGRAHHVSAIPDLKRLRSPKLLAAPEFEHRFEGLAGLRRVYGVRSLKMTPWGEAGEQYPALDKGRTDVAVVYTTDSQLASGRYRVLADPKGLFAEQRVAPVISRKALTAHGPKLAAAIDAVNALLTTKVLRGLNAKVDTEHRSPRAVADEFLRANGLK